MSGRIRIQEMVFTVPGTPRPKQSFRKGKGGRAVSVAVADPNLKAWTAGIVSAASEAARRLGLERRMDQADSDAPTTQSSRPVEIQAEFRFGTHDPKRHGKPHLSVPDADNLVKGVLDALQTAGVVWNDSAVMIGMVRKVWSRKAAAGATIVLRAIDQDDADQDDFADDAQNWVAGSKISAF